MTELDKLTHEKEIAEVDATSAPAVNKSLSEPVLKDEKTLNVERQSPSKPEMRDATIKEDTLSTSSEAELMIPSDSVSEKIDVTESNDSISKGTTASAASGSEMGETDVVNPTLTVEAETPFIEHDSEAGQYEEATDEDSFKENVMGENSDSYDAGVAAAWETSSQYKIDKGSPFEFYYIASAHRRVVAFIIDSLVVSGLVTLFFSMWRFTDIIDFAISTAIYCLYFAGMTFIFKGQTLGKMIMGLRTVRLDGYHLKLGDIFFREIIARIIQRPFPFLYIISFFTSEKKQIGDWVANTCVVTDHQ